MGATPTTPVREFSEVTGGSTGARRSWAYSTLGNHTATLEEVVRTAGDHGCTAVELRVGDTGVLQPGTDDDELDRISGALSSAGIRVLSVTSRVRLCAPGPSSPQLGTLQHHAHMAARLGARGVRVFMGDETGGDGPREPAPTPGEERAQVLLHDLAAPFLASGLKILVETHDSHPTGSQLGSFLSGAGERGVDLRHVGVIWDTAHSWSGGEAPSGTYAALSPWLEYLQLKDVLRADDPRPVLPGRGSYPIDLLADVLRRVHWHGWSCLEWERRWFPELEPLPAALDSASRWAAELLDSTAL